MGSCTLLSLVIANLNITAATATTNATNLLQWLKSEKLTTSNADMNLSNRNSHY